MRTITYQDLYNKLKELPLFLKMDESFISHFISLTELRLFGAHEIVVQEDEFEDACCVILSGEVGVFLLDKEESLNRVATLGRNDFFGEIATLSGHKRIARILCDTASEILFVNKKALFFWMDHSVDFKKRIHTEYSKRLLDTELQKLAVFRGQDKEFFSELKECSTVVDFQKDEKIIHPGEECSDLYIVVNGFAKVLVHEDRRRTKEYSDEYSSEKANASPSLTKYDPITAAYLSSGNYFGEIAPLKESKKARGDITVVALTRVELIRIDGEKYKALVRKYFDFSEFLDTVISSRSGSNVKVEGDLSYQKLLDWVISSEIIQADAVLFIDMKKCIRCESCINACEALYGGPRISLSGFQFKNILVPSSCRHCNDPVCMEGCPTGAIDRDYTGEVFHKNNCIGCGNCERNCPYNNIFMVPLVKINKKHRVLDFFNKDFLHKKSKTKVKRGITVQVTATTDHLEVLGNSQKLNKREVKRVATKCDLCKEYPFSGCVQSCPRNAITRVKPREYFSELNVGKR